VSAPARRHLTLLGGRLTDGLALRVLVVGDRARGMSAARWVPRDG
jgi:hypothetical protein